MLPTTQRILEKTGFIRREKRSDIVCYEVTVKGKEFLDKTESELVGSKIWRLHNAKYRYGLIRDGVWPSEWRKVEMTNWTSLLRLEGGVLVQHTPSSVIISVDALYGDNPITLVDNTKSVADRTAKTLMLKYNFSFGEGSLCRKPHFAFDVQFNFVSRYFEISIPEAKIDRSEGPGEIDFFGVKNAVDYLRLPEQVNKINDRVDVMSCEVSEIKSILEIFLVFLARVLKDDLSRF